MKAQGFAMNQGVPSRRPAFDLEGGRAIFGVHAIAAWLNSSPRYVLRILYDRSSKRAAELAHSARSLGIAIAADSRAGLQQIVGDVRHQGVVAICKSFPYLSFETLIEAAPTQLLVADHIQDPQNLGAVIRTADAAGVDGFVLPKDRCAGVTATVEAAAAGSTARLKIARVTNVVRAVATAKRRGYWVLGLVSQGGVNIYQFDPPQKTIVVLGGEMGMSPLLQQQCDFLVSIPMTGGVESLNASVAVGIALFEIGRLTRAKA